MKETGKMQFSFTLDYEEKERLETAAKEMGMTFTDFLKKGASFYASFDAVFRKKIKTFSQNIGIPEYLIIQNLAISWMARKEAREEVFGKKVTSILAEFMFTENKPVTGEKLHAILKRNFIQDYEKEKKNALHAQIEKGYIPNKKEIAWLEKMEEL